MAEFSKNLRNELSEFLLNEIYSKALDGITYTLILKNESDQEDYERYMMIRKEADRCGFDKDQVFRVFELNNGYIFDMDLSTAEQILTVLTKPLLNSEDYKDIDDKNLFSLMGGRPSEKRAESMRDLARYIEKEYKNGNTELTIALYNRNTTNRIMVTGKSPNGEKMTMVFKAFGVRHWDLGYLNSKLLIPKGIRISKIHACEILPSKTGVSFILKLTGV